MVRTLSVTLGSETGVDEMGRFERPASGGMTKYYWYPGERTDWVRAAIAGGCGLLTIILVAATTGSHLWAAVLGTSVTAGVAGVTFGRKDVRALQTFSGFAALDTGRAVWRALVKGFGAATAAVIVVHSANGIGFVASWLLPVVPAIVGAIAHQAGMMYERAAQAAAEDETVVATEPVFETVPMVVETVPAAPPEPVQVLDAYPVPSQLRTPGPLSAPLGGPLGGAMARVSAPLTPINRLSH